MMTLQPNQEIEDPHPPPNGKTIPHISAKHCVHRRGKTERVAWREENFHELFGVPRIDEPKVNIHRAVHRAFVSGERAFGLARTVEHFVKNISAFLAAEYRKKNSAAKDRINESGGVSCKQPAVAVQTCAAVGKIRFHVNL